MSIHQCITLNFKSTLGMITPMVFSLVILIPSSVSAETCIEPTTITVDEVAISIDGWSEAPDNTGFCLTVTSHDDGDFFSDPVQTISGTVGDAVDTLTIDGNSITILGDGSFSYTVTLANGWNNLKLKIADTNLRTATQVLALPYYVIHTIPFADANLEACVEAEADANGWTLISEMVTLNCRNDPPSTTNISNTSGLELLIALESLSLSGHSFSSLDVSLFQNLELLFLQRLDNLATVDLSGLSNLNTLHFNALPSFTINLPSLSSLESLSIHEMDIVSIDFSVISNIDYIELFANSFLTTTSGITFPAGGIFISFEFNPALTDISVWSR